MCCIFTCCGWMIDLVQRLWTFTMSCCISSAVCCVMLTASMSGIALGYNYSLAEYIDLKETNVSVYLKRGVFDDEIADDLDWRRAGRMPVAGHIGENNLLTGANPDESVTPMRSGRRLDDSVFEADDQNKYEGSLMKLTAKPPHAATEGNAPTTNEELPLGLTVGQQQNYYQIKPAFTTIADVDRLKALKNVLDSRRAMYPSGTTSPQHLTRTIPDNVFQMYANPAMQNFGGRRLMPGGLGPRPGPYGAKIEGLNPARFAVPDKDIIAEENWVLPKHPNLFKEMVDPELEIHGISPTYPPPIKLNSGPRTTPATDVALPEGPVVFLTRTMLVTPTSGDRLLEKLQKESQPFDKIMLEGEEPKQDYNKVKIGGSKTSEEEYEDEIKGLPVRKRRSINVKSVSDDKNTSAKAFKNLNDINSNDDFKEASSRDQSIFNNDTKQLDTEINNTVSVTISTTSYKGIYQNNIYNLRNNYTSFENLSFSINESKPHIYTELPSTANEVIYEKDISGNLTKSDLNITANITNEPNLQNTSQNTSLITLLDRITTVINKESSNLLQRSLKSAIRNKMRRKSFESKIVSSKYGANAKPPRLIDTEAASIKTSELLDSITVQLNEGELLSDPKSNFVKLLQSTFS